MLPDTENNTKRMAGDGKPPDGAGFPGLGGTVTQDRILILDDEPEIGLELREALIDEGYDADAATSPEALWPMTERRPVDLFIIDVMLGRDSGLKVAQRLREASDVGIIIVTGRAEEQDRVVGLNIGGDDYVVKPFGRAELVARIRSVLRRTKGATYPPKAPAQSDASVAAFAGFTLDLPRRHLTGEDGKAIPLTTAEFRLLETLVRRPQRPLSREYLQEVLHGRNWAGFDRTVDGLISRLRRKLRRSPGAPPLIQTVRGKGYVFTPDVSWR